MIYGETYNASIYPSKIWNPLKLIFSEPNVTLLNLISYFKNHLLGICKSSNQSFNIPMLIIPCHEPYSSLSFWLFGECPFLEKWQLANKFSDSKVGCDGNTLLPAKKELKNSPFFFFFLIKNVLPKNFATFSNVFKAKESPRVTFECRKRVSQPEFIDQDLQINMIMSYLEIKILFHKLTDFEKKLVAFPLLDSCLSAEMISESWKIVP